MATLMSDGKLVEALDIVLKELDARRELKRDIPDMIVQGLTSYFEDEIANASQESKFHVIARLHRDDIIAQIGKKKAGQLTEEDIEYIAKKMGNAYLEFGYWVDLKIIAEMLLEEREKKGG